METVELQELIATLLACLPSEASPARGGAEVAELVSALKAAPALEQVASTTRPAGTQEDGGSGVASMLGRSLISGFGVVSLFKGLFGSGDDESESVAALERFQLPEPVRASIAFDAEQRAFAAADYAHTGQLRTVLPSAATQVTVNVQAMDSRSFSEHSHEIARAVKEAMLNAHSLNDVIGEL
jgi:hypothetical protein